jgi:hypothetical protein
MVQVELETQGFDRKETCEIRVVRLNVGHTRERNLAVVAVRGIEQYSCGLPGICCLKNNL